VLKRNSADVAELGIRDFLPQNGILSLIGNEKRHFSLLFADAFDPKVEDETSSLITPGFLS
jgi:hypothetical protein